MTRGTLANRLAMWLALRAPAAKGFVSAPEPRSIGLFSRGKQLMAGNFLFAGQLVEAPGQSIWEITSPEPDFTAEAHGFAWLDDLAAVGDQPARARMQAWVWDWMARYGKGQGPGWTADLTGRRLIRWINHALMLLSGRDKVQSAALYHSLSAQVLFLARRWPDAKPGLPRFEALTGLIYAGLSLSGMEARVRPAVQALARECDRQIDASGGIPTRNPEELLEVYTLLSWALAALSLEGGSPPAALSRALDRMAPTLRALRHADGGLARFHGGWRGGEGLLDRALAASGVKPGPAANAPVAAMGFVRLQGGRTSVIIDAAPPPTGDAATSAHASTLAFEMTSGRRPVVVSCGSGRPFGQEWQEASRATPSHSTMVIDGFSSSRFGGKGAGHLDERANVLGLDPQSGPQGGMSVSASHDGWRQSHGVLHRRALVLSQDGRSLQGHDSLIAADAAGKRRLGRLLDQIGAPGIAFSLRFHLHPDVDAQLDMGGTAISLALKSGEIWVFRAQGPVEMTLQPSVYLERNRLRPRDARQIVLSGRISEIETASLWTLSKAQDTPLAIRDLDREDLPVPL